ncbi:MAG: hypothetical protein Q4B09_06940 [Lachnospiraceae bacterium]|nr:hypothetical protein [Lachnospiraceae bacterium]
MYIRGEIMMALRNAATVEEFEGLLDMYGIDLEDITDAAPVYPIETVA